MPSAPYSEDETMSSIKTAIVTGAAGLVGSETVRHFCAKGWRCIGIDNDMRSYFFGAEASTHWLLEKLLAEFPDRLGDTGEFPFI